MSPVAAILSASASVTVDAQDDTLVRVDYVALVPSSCRPTVPNPPHAEEVHYIASDGRYRRDETPAGGTPTSEYGLPRDGVHVSVNHSLLEAVCSGRIPPCQRRVARRPQPCHAARGRRDDGDRREDAGSDSPAGSRGGSTEVRAYGVLVYTIRR